MGLRFRKSKKLGKYGRISLSKSGGVGVSFGVPGFRIGISPKGKVRRTIGIPGDRNLRYRRGKPVKA